MRPWHTGAGAPAVAMRSCRRPGDGCIVQHALAHPQRDQLPVGTQWRDGHVVMQLAPRAVYSGQFRKTAISSPTSKFLPFATAVTG